MKKKVKQKIIKKFLKFIEYIIILKLWFFFSMFSLSKRKKIVEKILFWLIRKVPRFKKRVVDNLKMAYPEKSDQWIEEIAEGSLSYLGNFFAEFMDNKRINIKYIEKHMVMHHGTEKVKELLGGGGLVILGHLGNWEWHGAVISRMFPGKLIAIAKRQSNIWSNRLIEKIRSSQFIETIYSDENIFRFLRALKQKKILAMVADQDAGGSGKPFLFFGQNASTFMGPAVLARISNAPLFFAYSYHEDEKLHLHVEPFLAPECDRSREPERWENEFTQAWVSKLEEKIRLHPKEYFWIHNKWKTHRKVSNL